jgi:hypothetical protein
MGAANDRQAVEDRVVLVRVGIEERDRLDSSGLAEDVEDLDAKTAGTVDECSAHGGWPPMCGYRWKIGGTWPIYERGGPH